MKAVSTDRAPKAIGPYQQGVVSGGFLFVSGQIPLDPKTGDVVGSTMAEQGPRVLENIRGIVEAAGLSIADVVKTTVYLTDLADMPKFNELYAAFFGAHKPARAVLQAAALPKGVRLEMDAICSTSSKS